MDINNSMLGNSSNKKSDHINKSKKAKKSRINNAKIIQMEITCEKEPKTKYDIYSEEFAIHIIDCDDCLKKLFLSQAQRKEKESELLLDKSHKHKKRNNTSKGKRKRNI